MRKGFVILLLLCFAVQVTGYHLYFQYRKDDIKRAVRQRIREGIDPSQLTTLIFPVKASFSDPGPEWVEFDEIRYQGDMYDILEKRTEGDQLILVCLNDTREKNLINYYKDLTRKDFGEKSKKRAGIFLKLISQIFYQHHPVSPETQAGNIQPEGDGRSYAIACLQHEVPTPPPQEV